MLKTKTKPTRHRVTVLEQVTSSPARIDHASGVIYGVKILGATSRNNRVYTPGAMAEAAPQYEGVRVNLDHPPKQAIKSSRGMESWIGTLEHVVVKDSGVYGNLCLLKSHPYAGMILEAAERHPTRFGLSHNADVAGYHEGRKEVIESIEGVRSVDLVSRPATTNSIFEGVLEMDGMADMGIVPSMGPGADGQTDDAEAAGTDEAATLADIQTILDDTEMSSDEQVAGIKAILSGANRETDAVAESYDPRRSVARSVLEAVKPPSGRRFADLVRGPSTAHRTSTRKSSRPYSLVEQVQGAVDPKSALKFTDAKSFANAVR